MDLPRYNEDVRRLISITFLLLFSLPLISPVLAITAVSDANLPACCRWNGAHHCNMNMQQAESSGPGVSLGNSATVPRLSGDGHSGPAR
jgi:hypothetical protein